MEVFLHINARKIINIKITMLIDKKITNQSVQKRFINILNFQYQLAKRKLTFIGKVFRNS